MQFFYLKQFQDFPLLTGLQMKSKLPKHSWFALAYLSKRTSYSSILRHYPQIIANYFNLQVHKWLKTLFNR